MIFVCSLSRLQESVDEIRARHVVTLVRDESRVFRPRGIEPDDHLWLKMDDIAEPIDGYLAPAQEHVEALVGFLDRWDRKQPLVVHCFAGISRSTAAAFIAACALRPSATRPRSPCGCAPPRAPPRPIRGWWRWPTISSAGAGA